jgi:allantoate deiminase
MKLAVDGYALARDLAALAELGLDPRGGLTRVALSPADARARAYVRREMQTLGLTIAHDEVGNLIGRRAGSEAGAAAVTTGSHLDTVPQGGRYDGPYGVLGGLAALRALDAAGVSTRRPIEVVVFVGEEGSRFPRGTIGSAVMAGDVPVADILALRDADGVSFADALAAYGDRGAARAARRGKDEVFAFVELHIEQGGVLEARKLPIGAVTVINGLVQHIVSVTGDANHAGATPMDMRRDALAGACEMILAVEFIANRLTGGAVATVGRIEARPGGFNIIPGAASFSIDLRAPKAEVLDTLDAEIRESIAVIAEKRKLPLTVETRQRVQPGLFDEQVIGAVERAAAAAGLSSMRMPSGAIHDALHMANLCPSGMVFVPSRGGKSHCPEEDTSLEDLEAGATVLAHTLADLAAR